MELREIEVAGIKLAYCEEGRGSITVLFVHGNSLNAQTFSKQYSSELSNHYRLIAVDLPGHGNSDKATKPEETYNLPAYVDLLGRFIQELELSNVVLVGHSLGGHIAFGMSNDHDLPIKGVFAFGAPPINIPVDFEGAYLPHPTMGLAFKAELDKEEAQAFIEGCVLNDTPSAMVQSVLNTDPQARAELAASIGTNKLLNEVEIVKNSKLPIAIIHGRQDVLINPLYFEGIELPTLWKNAVQFVEESGHSPQLEQAEAFNSLLAEFIESL